MPSAVDLPAAVPRRLHVPRRHARWSPTSRDLGVTHCYASPYLKARPGSTHGYDIIDHSALNPEIGTEEDYDALVGGAAASTAWARSSTSCPTTWASSATTTPGGTTCWRTARPRATPATSTSTGTPRPGPNCRTRSCCRSWASSTARCSRRASSRLAFDDGGVRVQYYDHRFPVAPQTLRRILEPAARGAGAAARGRRPGCSSTRASSPRSRNLPTARKPTRPASPSGDREKEVIKRRLATAALEQRSRVREFIERNVALFNGTPGDPRSFDLLDDLLDAPVLPAVASGGSPPTRSTTAASSTSTTWPPSAWSSRRSSTPTHGLILRLLARGQGRRPAHRPPRRPVRPAAVPPAAPGAVRPGRAPGSAGERDPADSRADWQELEGAAARATRRRLDGRRRPRLSGRCTSSSRRSSAPTSRCPTTGPVHGTTGYDFLNRGQRPVRRRRAAPARSRGSTSELDRRRRRRFAEVVYQKKRLILQVVAGQRAAHAGAPARPARAEATGGRATSPSTACAHALREVIACFPVYRTYITRRRASERPDRRYVETAVRRRRRAQPGIEPVASSTSSATCCCSSTPTSRHGGGPGRAAALRRQVPAGHGAGDGQGHRGHGLLRLQPPGLAQRGRRRPGRFGVSRRRRSTATTRTGRRDWPHALSPLSTHDTKRSEDVRARINVLSELPERVARVRGTLEPSSTSRTARAGRGPDGARTATRSTCSTRRCVGAWPLEPLDGRGARASSSSRIQAYMDKALHEAKVHTSWINPNAGVRRGGRAQFVGRILDAKANRGVPRRLPARSSGASATSGCSTRWRRRCSSSPSPGVPDIYQGTELWDFSLVDPDNRRPVDYDRRKSALQELQEAMTVEPNVPDLARHLLASRADGRIKLYVTYRSLQCRRDHPDLFTGGDYWPCRARANGRSTCSPSLGGPVRRWL